MEQKSVTSGSVQTKENGATLVEFSLCLPIIMMFISASLEFGNILSQLTWLGQSTYNLVAVGAESPQSVALDLINSRFEQLQTAKEFERFRGRLEITSVEPLVPNGSLYDNDPARRSVSLRLKARVIPISSLNIGFPIDIAVTAPQLVEQSTFDPNYSTFGRPQPYFYGCNESNGAYPEAGSSGNDSPCLTTCSPVGTLRGTESCV